MINSILKLKRTLHLEFSLYFPNKFVFLKAILLHENNYYIWKYQKTLRKLEYFKNKKHHTVGRYFDKLLYIWYSIRTNQIGRKLSIDMWHSSFKEGLHIYHTSGGIIVNSNARIGKNCHLHGNNCIGNNGIDSKAPILGDNCSLGVGAKIIGEITLGNNIKVAAGAVVINSFSEDNIVLAGVPATIKKRLTLINE